MEPIYRNTQYGYLIVVVMAVGVLVTLGVVQVDEAWILAPFVLLLVVVGFMFSRLTTEVTQEFLTLRFGAGWPRKRIAITDIVTATVVRNPWYYGWGIRLTPRGWLWNVSGAEAVELKLRSRSTFRVGTNEPDRLASALASVGVERR
jgi:hypothetical protein